MRLARLHLKAAKGWQVRAVVLRSVRTIDDVLVSREPNDFVAMKTSNGDAAIPRRIALAATPLSL
jgi:hypothetical protein